jgi:hypothetical protein
MKRRIFESTHEAALFTALGSVLVDNNAKINIRGSHREMSALTSALESTQRFQQELYSPSATVESVMKAYESRTAAARSFESLFGVRWPL